MVRQHRHSKNTYAKTNVANNPHQGRYVAHQPSRATGLSRPLNKLTPLTTKTVLNTFGVYQTYYESGQLYSETSSNISWIGSIQSFTVLLVGALTGSVFDAGHLRLLLSLGAFGIVFGHMMLSLCDEWWQCLLAQGFVIGMGGGCLYVPAVAIMPQYFRARLGLALGLAASGSSMG